MKHILLCDTSIGTDNVGDGIIMDFCEQQILKIFADEMFYLDRVPTHLEIGKAGYKLNENAEYSFVCGTNILKTSMLLKKCWKIGLEEAVRFRGLCLMGAGWGNYNKYGTDPYTKFVYQSVLSNKLKHSVRDSFTEQKLKKIGIENVINTTCPTMWRLSENHCMQIPTSKAKQVVTALTFYKKDVDKDIEMLKILDKNYEKIYLWLQQADDYEYFLSLNSGVEVEFVRPILKEYDKLLKDNEIDFIGSRLHGGIRALNHKRRAIIVGIDNRAIEIHKDTNLPFINREEIDKLDTWINGNTRTEIVLPIDAINEWRVQFKL